MIASRMSELPGPLAGGLESAADRTAHLRWVSMAVLVFVILGALMRLLRFLLRFPLWGDEAALAANLLDRSFLDLLRPLDYQQVAPPLFMWIQLGMVRLFGFNEYSLRVFPLACSLASLVLFWHMARLVCSIGGHGHVVRLDVAPPGAPIRRVWPCLEFSELALLLAVAIFSVSYYPLRHGVEAKQYSSDLVVSLLLLLPVLHWVAARHKSSALWWLVAIGPLALSVSHPAAFVSAGIGISLIVLVSCERSLRLWLPVLAYNAAIAVSFGALYLVSIGPQATAAADEGIMSSYWARSFPPVASPLPLIKWLVAIHAGQLFAYPAGGSDVGAGAAALLCFIVGIVLLCRTRRGPLAMLFLSPFVLTLVAASLGRYPYGGFARTSQHVAPIICLVAGIGAARLIFGLPRDRLRRVVQLALCALLGAFATGQMVKDVAAPYRTEHDRRVREFARWFWHDKAVNAQLVCARADLDEGFFRQTYLWRGIAQYLCNQRIYSGRMRGVEPDWSAVSRDRPLRCVVFSRPGLSRDEAAFDDWLSDMQDRFAWVGYERNDFFKPHDHGPDIERIEVYEFVPRSESAVGARLQGSEFRMTDSRK